MSAKKRKDTRGGARAGAGRPTTITATVRITVTIDPTTLDTLKGISPNLSEAVRIAAARYAEEQSNVNPS